MSDNIKVVVKVRPLISREIEDKLFRQWRVKNNTLYQIDQNGKDILNGYTFDKVYDENTKTTDVYDDVAKPIVEAAAAGFNGTIFAYGQTSSGKTYTMTGTEESLGIIPLSVTNLFDIIKNIPDRDFLIRVSYVEIYNETLIDLLNTEKKNIKIHDTLQGVKVDATVRVTTSPEEVLQFMREGQANRQTGSTNMNEESSRSHSIFQITIESREQSEDEEVGCLNVSQLNLVDLAGSERSGQTGATGIRFKEGTHINKSLSSLALVIKQLSEGQSKHVSYRDSKLTRILQNSLGGNAKTSIICAVTPAAVEETISTLQFASRAKAIKNSPEVNVVATDTKMIDSLTKQLSSLKTQLESKRNVEEDNHKLQKQIAVLQRFLKGFGQRTSADMMTGSRRKLQQMRRATISTPHIRQEDPTPTSAPRFCTPSLKYNPALLANSTEFLPINSMTNLASVPEEPIRIVTPPPREHIINEIIELDSDDDGPSDVQTCSPYHKCFNSSKTPPCVLRKSAMEAEKNFKDLVELTGREKIYTPNLLELIEKLEESTSVIAKLEKNIDTLNKAKEDNESLMEKLKEKINKTEEEVRNITSAKLQLEARCIEYDTKLTDWEVMYDTLKKKAKTREEELLNRLEEFANVKTTNHIKSDTKTLSGTDSHSVPSSNIEDLIKDLKEQISERDKSITNLESRLHEQSEKVLSLEKQTQVIQASLDSSQIQLSKSEDENILHKTTIKTLNSIIENQKSNLESATTDLETSNNTIQQLQDELNKKEKLLKITLTDTEIDNLIMNEEKMIANNENINNIIQSLKVALDSKNNEIKNLKSLQNNEAIDKDKEISEELNDKQTQILHLQEKVTLLEKQLEENNIELSSLLKEKSSLLLSAQVVNEKLSDFQKNNEELCNQIKSYESESITLKERNQELENEKQHFEAEIIEIKSQLTSQAKNYLEKISHLEDDLMCKNAEIDAISRKVDVSTYENRVKEIITKLQDIVVTLTVETKEFTQLDDNDLDALETIDDKFNALESTTIEVANQINVFKANLMKNLTKHLILEISSLNSEINVLENAIMHHTKDMSGLNEMLNNINNDVKNNCLKGKNNSLDEFAEEYLLNEDSKLLSEIDALFLNLKQKIENLKLVYISSFESLTQIIKTKNSEIAQFTQEIENLEMNLENKSQELLSIVEDSNDIIRKIVEIGSMFNIENNLSCDVKKVCDKKIVSQMLDKVVYEYLSKSKQLEECAKHIENLVEAQNKVRYLTDENLHLVENISKVTKSNSDIAAELQAIRKEKQSLARELGTSAELLKDLRDELKTKAKEIDDMEGQVLQWKEQFAELDILMKKQLHDLQEENAKLRQKVMPNESLQCKEYDDAECNKSDIKENATYKPLLPTKSDVLNSPPSLLTISCNKIIEFIQDIENNSQSCDVTPSASKSNVTHTSASEHSNICFECDKLQDAVKILHDENTELKKYCDDLKATNERLTKETQDAYEEIKDLVRCTSDLQKKILSHRTNLSTLTATTYAENKSLSSQVKFLQLHHTRFHTVCQRDLPELKEQLRELMTLLKEENLESKLNSSFKRYSLPVPLDSNSIMYSFKNESTLDGDILMLDTNLTVTTSADNTLTGLDQTCCEITQTCPYTDASSQTTSCMLNESTYHELYQDQNIIKKLDTLQKENEKLNQLVHNSQHSKPVIVKVNVETSPIKEMSIQNTSAKNACEICEQEKEQRAQLPQEIEKLKEKLLDVTNQRNVFERKYNDLSLEVPSTEGLLRKLHNFEKELENKGREIEKLSAALKSTKDVLSGVQEENDNLSTQVMEFLSEIDDLKKELDTERTHSKGIPKFDSEHSDKATNDRKAKLVNCLECIQKDEHIRVLESKCSNTHTRLNRSYSDSDSSSRYNKICTLQNELDAGREDCNELKEEVTTIKNQLESNNMSMSQAMDLDESIGDTNVADAVTNKSVMPKITEEHASDIYNHDKLDCFNYYVEKIGDDKTQFNGDLKIIDLMKTLYCKLMAEHENRIEIMLNQIKDYEDSKLEMQEKINSLTKDLCQSDCNAKDIEKKLTVIRNNISILVDNALDSDALINLFNEKVLMLLDSEFSINVKSIFGAILQQALSKNLNDLNEAINKYGQLEEYTNKIKQELDSVSNELLQLKSRLSDKENEFNLLAAQKAKIHEINNALTLDLVKKEEELSKTIDEVCRKLAEEKIIIIDDIYNTLPPIKKIQFLINILMQQNSSRLLLEREKDIDNLKQEVAKYKSILDDKAKELFLLTEQFEKTKELAFKELKDKDGELQTQKSLYHDLNAIYNAKVEENNVNSALVRKLSEEVSILKESISTKDTLLRNLQTQLSELKQSSVESESKAQLLHDITTAKEELDKLKLINENLTIEKEGMAVEFEKLKSAIERNKAEREKMESDILVLKESVKENNITMDSLKSETVALVQHNSHLKEQLEEKCKELSRLEFNIKTHETTAKIQTKMISRLQKQKDDDATVIKDKDTRMAELKQKCETLQKESVLMNDCITTLRQEVDSLKHLKQSLEEKVTYLESCQDGGRKARCSMESVTDSSRRRRQSIHDSMRTFDDNTEDRNKVESVSNSRTRADELMDVDEDSSYRSTPVRFAKGRDSLVSKNEESEEEDRASRSSSAMAARRRRRSIHDQQRLSLRTTPDTHDLMHNKPREDSKTNTPNSSNVNSAVIELQERLTACQQELEELKERYAELDEECETCAEYLRERDEQCARLKKEKAALEKIITELNEKIQNNTISKSSRATFAHAAVNTDEDWANLHSVVVDRMSFDAEVEKNKRLTRTIEELRFNKQELKMVVAKMQRALEEKTTKNGKELERTRVELHSCREELEDLKRRNKELDEECETCAQYLRERDEQCRRLKESIVVLEGKLQESQEGAGHVSLSMRKKRQTLHDLNRHPAAEQVDASTEIGEDFLSCQVERDAVTDDTQTKLIKKLKATVEKLTEQKALLEHRLMAAPTAPAYVATGSAIVQNQQLTDVMKENRKLKKMNAELITLCKKRGKAMIKSNRENQDPTEEI